MKILVYLFFVIFFLSNKSISSNVANDLEKLSNLYKSGMITKEEFNKSKSLILKKITKKMIKKNLIKLFLNQIKLIKNLKKNLPV